MLCATFPLTALVALFAQVDGVGFELVKAGIGWLIYTSIWVTYLYRSRRVRVTFESAVRSDDSSLQRFADAGTPFRIVDEGPSADLLSQNAKALPSGFGKSSEVDTDTDDKIFAAIADELETGAIDKALWTRLFAECGGDERKQKVRYIQIRAERLRNAKAAPVFVKAPTAPVQSAAMTPPLSQPVPTSIEPITSERPDTQSGRNWSTALLQECDNALLEAGYKLDTDFSGAFVVRTPDKQKVKLTDRQALNEYLSRTIK